MSYFGTNDDNIDLDEEYFQQLVDSKLDNINGSYMEQLAIKEASGSFNPDGKYLQRTLIFLMCIDEFQNAIDEIKKNEKDFTIIAMYANSLRERSDELQTKVT